MRMMSTFQPLLNSALFITTANTKNVCTIQFTSYLGIGLTKSNPEYVPLCVNVFEKLPNSGNDAVPIHQNPSFVDEPEFKSYSIWIPLQDVDKDNGTVGSIEEKSQSI